MLIPRFSIRWVLLLTTVLAVLLMAVRQAMLGQVWAMAFAAVLALLSVAFLTYAIAFMTAYGLARAIRVLHPVRPSENPFVVEGEYPPQIIPQRVHGDEV